MEQLAAGLEAVHDQQAGAVRIPLGADVAGQLQGEVGLLARRHVPHQGLPAAPALVADEQAGVAVDRREAQDLQAQLLPAALGVVQLGDLAAVAAQDAQRRVHRVAVLGVLDRDQGAVVGEVADARRLAVPVDLRRGLARVREVDGRTVLVRRAADHRRAPVPAEGEARRVGGVQAGHGRLVRAAREGLAPPDAELVAVLVVEPPDPLAVGREHAVRRAVGPVRDLALLAARAVPGVQLVRPRRVRHEQGAVRGVLGPVGQRHPRRPEPLLPVGHLPVPPAPPVRGPLVPVHVHGRVHVRRNGLVALSHGPILPRPGDTAQKRSPACGQPPPPARLPPTFSTAPLRGRAARTVPW